METYEWHLVSSIKECDATGVAGATFGSQCNPLPNRLLLAASNAIQYHNPISGRLLYCPFSLCKHVTSMYLRVEIEAYFCTTQ